MPAPDQLRDVVATYIASVTAGDVDTIVGLYADDATLEDPYGGSVRRGREEIATHYSGMAGMKLEAELVTVRAVADTAAFQLDVRMHAGSRVTTISSIDVMTFDEQGRITAMRAYWGNDDVAVSDDPAGA
ncbi:nuclear transport factor 2 family protein [Rhodococcus sp. X156]|uniref:nuclear transport factor 2 family protein n=1 Tax=Rhodococcus sp. X156 TaxID=2499145 RepID=UPI000FDC64F3|nr:nuclear transport factor 2 family protein [Rhodococcus sp. X156]